MLTCLTKKTGKRIYAGNYQSRRELAQIGEELICPITQSKVFYRTNHFRKGRPVQSHFVSTYADSYSNTDVILDPEYFKQKQGFFYPGESAEHLDGKEYVSRQVKEVWPEYSDAKIELEYLVKIPRKNKRRIIDVAFVLPFGFIVAHEVQLCSITPDELLERTEDYRCAGIDVVWWLGKSANTQPNRDWYYEYFSEHPPQLVFSCTTDT